MREILPGIFTWGSTYADKPWDLNGYAITFQQTTVLVDPPMPSEDDWPRFDAMNPITQIVLGDAIIGNPPGQLSLIPESKLDDPLMLRQSLRKLLNYDFDVLLLCDGESILNNAKPKVAEFLNTLY